jgi:hypothetical protein
MPDVIAECCTYIAANLPDLMGASQQLLDLDAPLLTQLAQVRGRWHPLHPSAAAVKAGACGCTAWRMRLTTVVRLAGGVAALQMATEAQLEALAEACSSSCTEAAAAGSGSRGGGRPGAGTADQLTSKLFKLKLETTLRELQTSLARCSACGQQFSAAAHQLLDCPVAQAAAAAEPLTDEGGGSRCVQLSSLVGFSRG